MEASHALPVPFMVTQFTFTKITQNLQLYLKKLL